MLSFLPPTKIMIPHHVPVTHHDYANEAFQQGRTEETVTTGSCSAGRRFFAAKQAARRGQFPKSQARKMDPDSGAWHSPKTLSSGDKAVVLGFETLTLKSWTLNIWKPAVPGGFWTRWDAEEVYRSRGSPRRARTGPPPPARSPPGPEFIRAAPQVWWSAFFGALGRDWKGLKAHDVCRNQQVPSFVIWRWVEWESTCRTLHTPKKVML